jgi:ketosteroid isomerase-like protein
MPLKTLARIANCAAPDVTTMDLTTGNIHAHAKVAEVHGGSMDIETQKKIAVELLHASESCDAAKAAALINPDFHFQFMEKAASWSVDGQVVSTRLDKETFLKYGVTAVKNVTKDGMHFKVHVSIAEGPYVALFGESHATSNKGKPYNNNYCWRFKFSHGKVSEFLEFCDTHHAHEVLFE